MKFTPSKAIEDVSSQNPVVAIGIPEGSRTTPAGLTRVPYKSVLVPDRKSCQTTRKVPAPKATDEPPAVGRGRDWKPALVQHGSVRAHASRVHCALVGPIPDDEKHTGAERDRNRGAAERLSETDADPVRVEHVARWGDPSRSRARLLASRHPDDEEALTVERNGRPVFVIGSG